MAGHLAAEKLPLLFLLTIEIYRESDAASSESYTFSIHPEIRQFLAALLDTARDRSPGSSVTLSSTLASSATPGATSPTSWSRAAASLRPPQTCTQRATGIVDGGQRRPLYLHALERDGPERDGPKRDGRTRARSGVLQVGAYPGGVPDAAQPVGTTLYVRDGCMAGRRCISTYKRVPRVDGATPGFRKAPHPPLAPLRPASTSSTG
ncbi:hypothetical protein P7C73_g6738, partial [Tremellales sp. Uapishka_1]